MLETCSLGYMYETRSCRIRLHHNIATAIHKVLDAVILMYSSLGFIMNGDAIRGIKRIG